MDRLDYDLRRYEENQVRQEKLLDEFLCEMNSLVDEMKDSIRHYRSEYDLDFTDDLKDYLREEL